MYMERKEDGSVVGRFVKERRSGIDRRMVTYDYFIPERRIPWDRRQKQQPCAAISHGAWTDMRQYA